MTETFGKYLINQELPPELQIKGELTKGSFKKSISDFAQQHPERYAKVITKLKHLGDSMATNEGLSVGLDDITPQYKARSTTLAPYQKKFNNAKTVAEKQGIVSDVSDQLMVLAMKHPGTLTQQVHSGARGNKQQYANIISGMGYARDMNGGAVPWMISKSYAEGLKPSDYYAATNQSTMDVVKTQTSVSEPGELAKKLINIMNDGVITEHDCGTVNGLLLDSLSPDVIDRYLARPVGSFKHNTLITSKIQSDLAKQAHQILVRSPLTCEAADGVCQFCQGLDEKGHIHTIGVNVGVRSAQAMAEPLTQIALNAKHGGRTLASDRNQVHGIAGLRQIIETPKTFENKATLASISGKVTKIVPAPQGGHIVFVEEAQHYVLPQLKVLVHVGDVVEQGDVLSDGVPKPDEIVALKGLGTGRLYVVKTLADLYKGQGRELDQRHLELFTKSSMNHVRILDDPSHQYIKGDIVGFNTIKKDLSSSTKSVPTLDALGETLGKGYLEFVPGTRVLPSTIKRLRANGIKDVLVSTRAPEIEFVMKSATTVPRLHPDWMARMAHQGIRPTLLHAAHFGESSDLHSAHPVPAYVHGVEFGQGENGAY